MAQDTNKWKISKYEIVKEIGSGSMGKVYLAFDPFINREVAVKVANSNIVNEDEANKKYKKLFFNEARVVGMLTHPNIIPLYDAGMENNQYYLVMQYVKGSKTLKPYCNIKTLLPIEKALGIIYKCAKALAYAHSMGIIHKDIKPSNIMLTETMDVRLGDFGIAVFDKLDDTQIKGLIGSPKYMSSEQIKDDKITQQTDVYSLGVVMYELLTGAAPFIAKDIPSLVDKILNMEPPPPSFYNPDIPEPLEEITLKALEKNTDKRYANMNNFAKDLLVFYKNMRYSLKGPKEYERFTMLKKLNFFKDFSNPEIWEVIKSSAWCEIQEGDHIVKEGEIDDSFFIIVQGKVTVRKDNKDLVCIHHDNCFGEMSYITKSERTATIVAATDVVLLNVSGELLSQTSPSCQFQFNKIFLKTLIERLSKTTTKLSSLETQYAKQ
ncbi:cyclic nucleotide-binding protein,protein kinase family protein [Candidatus Magnetoovum chiemensis]|nr:cyclic nucleotide-binding protein,protein kinase family protein [Candidatus Magnetoovum chiemensis]